MRRGRNFLSLSCPPSLMILSPQERERKGERRREKTGKKRRRKRWRLRFEKKLELEYTHRMRN